MGNVRRIRYQINYKEGKYPRRSFAYTLKTAKDKAQILNGTIKKVKFSDSNQTRR